MDLNRIFDTNIFKIIETPRKRCVVQCSRGVSVHMMQLSEFYFSAFFGHAFLHSMDKDEAQKVLDAFKDDPIQPIVYMALFYGLRKSEVLGLKWENVNFEEDTFEIKSTIVKNKTIIESDVTKTDESNAVFQLLPKFRKILLDLKAEQDGYREMFGNAYNDMGYVFCRPDGKYYRPDSFTRTFQRKLKNAGLPSMRFHDLRHSTASVLYDLGWDIERIKNWLRHADIETISNIYTHISKERKRLMAEEISDLYIL